MSMQVKPKEGSVGSPPNQPVRKLRTKQKALSSAIAQPSVSPETMATQVSNVVQMPTDEERAVALSAYNERVKVETDQYNRWLYSYTGLSDGKAPPRTEKSVVPIQGTDKVTSRRKNINHVLVCMLQEGETWGNHGVTARMHEARNLESLERRRRHKETLVESFPSEQWEYKTKNPTSGWGRSERPPSVKQLIAYAPFDNLDDRTEESVAIIDKMYEAVSTRKMAEKISDNLQMYGTPLSKLELDLETGREVLARCGEGIYTTEYYLKTLLYRGQCEEMLSANDDIAPHEVVLSTEEVSHLLGVKTGPFLPSPSHFIMQDQLIHDLYQIQRNPELVDRESHDLVKLQVTAKLWGQRQREYEQWLKDWTEIQSRSLSSTRAVESIAYREQCTQLRIHSSKILKLLDQHASPRTSGQYGLAAGRRGKVGVLRPWKLEQPQLSWPGGPVYRIVPKSTIRNDENRWYQWWCSVMISSGQGDEFRRQQTEYVKAGTIAETVQPTTQEEPAQEEVTLWEEFCLAKKVRDRTLSEEELAKLRESRLEREMPFLVLDTEKLPELPTRLDGSVDFVGPPAPPCFKTNLVDLVDRRKEPTFSEIPEVELALCPTRGLLVPKDRVSKPVQFEELLGAMKWKRSGPSGLFIPQDAPGTLSRWLDTPLFK